MRPAATAMARLQMQSRVCRMYRIGRGGKRGGIVVAGEQQADTTRGRSCVVVFCYDVSELTVR